MLINVNLAHARELKKQIALVHFRTRKQINRSTATNNKLQTAKTTNKYETQKSKCIFLRIWIESESVNICVNVKVLIFVWTWKCEYLCESERRHHPPGCDWHGPEVQVVPNCVLEVVVNSPFREPRVQVLAQVGRYRTWKSEWTVSKSTIIIFQRFSFFLNLYLLTSSDESNAEKLIINITFQTLFQCFAWLVAQIPMNINNANKIPIHIWCKLTLDSFRKK